MRKTTLLSLMGSLIAFAPAALAADIPARPVYKSPAAVVAATHNWTGIYVGGHAGYGWAKVKGNDEFGDPGSGDLDGFIGGGQVGANYQIGNVVLGVEGEYSYSDVKKEISLVPFFGAGDLKVRNEYYITATGRLGYAFDRVLVYAKGGAAWTREKWDVNDGVGGAITGRFSRTGWLVGGGAEWMIFGNWWSGPDRPLVVSDVSFLSEAPQPSRRGCRRRDGNRREGPTPAPPARRSPSGGRSGRQTPPAFLADRGFASNRSSTAAR
jgi:outer membrane immunogenic protein